MDEKILIDKGDRNLMIYAIVFLLIAFFGFVILHLFLVGDKETEKDIYYHALELSLVDLKYRTYKQGICADENLNKTEFAQKIVNINYTDNYIRWAKGIE